MNSNLEIIERNAFSYSKIKEIYFPSSLRELKEGRCHEINELTKINISPKNQYFIFKEDKYLIFKTKPSSGEFDKLLFVSRDIKEISIPSNVIQISGIYNHILVLTEEGKVYSKGSNLYGELGTGDYKDLLKHFYEISSLSQYKIKAVSAGEQHSLFLTSERTILECGKNELDESPKVLPVITSFKKGVEFLYFIRLFICSLYWF